jgi:putative ATP-dependent endonuclease of OLD family
MRNFRGFSALELCPGGTHCVLVGEPGAGRSDIIEGLSRVLALDAAGNAPPDEHDFHDRRLTHRAAVEVTLGDLSEEMEHTFLDRLELWDGGAATVAGELANAPDMDAERFETVVRLCYRAQWSEAEEAATHWVDFAKTSDPATESWDRLGRAERALLPFVRLRPSSRTLELAPGSVFRRLVEATAGDDLAAALGALTDALEQSADLFAASEQVRAAMETILAPVRSSLGRGGDPADVTLGFVVHGARSPASCGRSKPPFSCPPTRCACRSCGTARPP